MLPYWILFVTFAALTLFTAPYKISYGKPDLTLRQNFNLNIFKWLAILSLTFFIGLRYEVGGDWLNYKEIYFDLAKQDLLGSILLATDPLFGLINWLSGQLFLSDSSDFGPLNWKNKLLHGYVLVNLFSAFIFCVGLIKFCFSLPRPLLALVVAVPYLITVVSMGYVRQAAALGFIMYGIAALNDNNLRRFIILTLIAALIHKASLIMLPMAVFISSKNRLLIFAGIALLAISFGIILLESYLERIYLNYIEAEYSSSGAIFRLGMLVPPSLLYLYFQDRFRFNKLIKNLWKIFSITSLFLFLLLFLTSFSTFIDRIALFLLPLQMSIFSCLPDIFNKKHSGFLIAATVVYSGFVLFVWLNFAANSWAWIPYENVLFLEQSNISYKMDSPKT